MKTLKIGRFPGEIKEYTVELGTTVAQALEMAGLSVDNESCVKADGMNISMNDTVDDFALLTISKQIKGA